MELPPIENESPVLPAGRKGRLDMARELMEESKLAKVLHDTRAERKRAREEEDRADPVGATKRQLGRVFDQLAHVDGTVCLVMDDFNEYVCTFLRVHFETEETSVYMHIK